MIRKSYAGGVTISIDGHSIAIGDGQERYVMPKTWPPQYEVTSQVVY
jgi:hypothetical protein